MRASEGSRDMVVRLYELPRIEPLLNELRGRGIAIRRALAPEQRIVVRWADRCFNAGWADECNVAFAGHPISCFVATRGDRLVGISVYDAIARGVAGPLGIDVEFRGTGVGKALFVETLRNMRAQGYAYAILGWIMPQMQPYFHKIVGAQVIDGSVPQNGLYKGLLVDKSRTDD